MDKQQLASTVNKVLDEMRQRPIPIGISSRHIHLAAADYARLFPAQPIQPKKALLQPGQYAAEQTVTLVGPKGRLNNVRLLGPLRQTSQVEISRTDARILGIAAPLRMSGNLQGTPGIRLISPFAELELSGGTIVAQRHIHMSPLDALILRVSHGDSVAVAIEGSDRRLIFDNVAVRVAPDMRLEMHIDTDEANAAGADAAQAWPPRSVSRRIASRTTRASYSRTKVFTARRRAGGVAMIDRSRIPLIAMFSVRGIGVAVRVRISTSARIALMRSLCRTPNRCSSSTISSPRSRSFTSLCSSLWVPIKISILPSAACSRICACSLALRKRESISMRTGQLAKRSRKLS